MHRGDEVTGTDVSELFEEGVCTIARLFLPGRWCKYKTHHRTPTWVDDALHEPDQFSLDAMRSFKSDRTGFRSTARDGNSSNVSGETGAPTSDN
jgi:hypothetical protein